MMCEAKFELKIDLNALNHLGLNLYSNVPAVLAELIANAWDADASKVWLDIIDISDSEKHIKVRDNGCGMDENDLKDKFLTVGYRRRKDAYEDLTPGKRKVMGRKGIGKLSIFSIAEEILIFSKKADSATVGLKLDADKIRQDIENNNPHYPESIDPVCEDHGIEDFGTLIVLSRIKKRIYSTLDQNLRKRVARRFSVISSDFVVYINSEPVITKDRDYLNEVEYAFFYDSFDKKMLSNASEENLIERDFRVCRARCYSVRGWIGLVSKSGDLYKGGDNLNQIPILVRGKVALEDILDSISDAGLYTKYVVGELEADFMDLSDQPDITTSSRQDFLQSDHRYSSLRDFVRAELKQLSKNRVKFKQAEGKRNALQYPAVRNWFGSLRGNSKKVAEKLFGRINSIAVDEQQKLTLFQYGILAFEHLHHKEKLEQLNCIDIDDLGLVVELFSELDDIEATWYYKITRGRLEIIRKLAEMVDENVFEKVIQRHIYEHLWLLDPSWERATATPHFERKVKYAFDHVARKENEEVRSGRIDIQYRKTSGRHVIVELKRANARLRDSQLMVQIENYIDALETEIHNTQLNFRSSESL